MKASNQHAWPTRSATSLLLLAALAFVLAAVPARGAGDSVGSRWALLIGVEKYRLAPPLIYTINDVKQLGETLRNQGGYTEDCVLEMVETAPTERFQPWRKSILEEVPPWLSRVGEGDQVLIYFSGHGFRDKDGKLYLAPIDCDPKNPVDTGIPVQWLREQLATCKAKIKLLILDACHAGADKGNDESSSVSAKDLAGSFEGLTRVMTLASSKADEQSQIWPEMQQSLFSYWVNQALKGHADRNGDGKIDIEELYEYVYGNVTHISDPKLQILAKNQTPVRSIGPGVEGTPDILRLKVGSLKATLSDMAQQMARAAKLARLPAVGVTQFNSQSSDPKVIAELGGQFELLARWCAQELQRPLARAGGKDFKVLDHDAVQQTLRVEQLASSDLATGAVRDLVVKDLNGQAKDAKLPAMVVGTFNLRTGRVVSMQCSLLSTDNQQVLGVARGTAALNESEWAMLGHSGSLKPGAWAPAPGRESRVQAWEEAAQGAHPLLRQDAPYRVRIMVRGQERPLEFRDHNREAFVTLRKDEIFEIWIENRTSQPIFLRLLVDGLNTLPETAPVKDMVVEPVARAESSLSAQRVNLAEALAWKPAANSVTAVRGFYSQTGEQAKYREFKVVDAGQSVAAQRGFPEQIGLITAALYRPHGKGASRGVGESQVGTGFGKEYNSHTDTYSGEIPGEMIEVIQIHYGESQ